jgi:hypothetical protein
MCRTSETGVRLRIDSDNATIDMGHHPEYPIMVKVAELAINYKTRENPTDGDIKTVSEVTGITYMLTGGEDPMAFVHPDYLDQPDEWPAWVRKLVEEHRPAAA